METEVRHAQVVTADEEDQLSLSSVMNVITPKGLQRAVFSYVGKVFCIRGGQEQRPSNFRFVSNPGSDPHCVFYEEHGSNNHPGGLKDLLVENKSVPCFAVTENVPKCRVYS